MVSFWIDGKEIFSSQVMGAVFFCNNKDLGITNNTTPKHPATCLAFYPSELKPLTGRMVHGTDARNHIAKVALETGKGHLLNKGTYGDLDHDTVMMTAQSRDMNYRKVFYSKYYSSLYFRLQVKDLEEIRRQEQKHWRSPAVYGALHE